MALNETTGTVLWSAGPNGQPSFNFSTRAGVTIDAGNVFAGTQDSRLVSLNAMNGALNWQTSNLQGIKRADLTEYEGPEATPLVYNGEIIVGESRGGHGGRGFLRAFNESDGAPLWIFFTVPPDPMTASNQAFYNNTWGASSTCTGGAVWNVPAVDPQTGIIYFATVPTPDVCGSGISMYC